MNATDRDAKMAALMLKAAVRALQRAETYATTDPDTKQQIADLKASVARTAATFGEKLRLKAAPGAIPEHKEPGKLNVSNG